MNDKIVVELYDADVIAVVVEHPTGVIYRQQCGGISCLYPEVEGYVIPFTYRDDWDEYTDKLCEFGCYGNDLVGFNEGFPINMPGIELDKTRLDKGTEAFVPVTYYGKSAWMFFPNNCD